MLVWLNTLGALERVLFYVAVPATVLLLLQTALLLVGIGGGNDASPDGGVEIDLDGDGIPDGIDLDGDGIPDVPAGYHDPSHLTQHGDGPGGRLNVLTLRGIVAFLSLFGWSGLLFLQSGLHWFWSLFLAVQLGIIGMVAVALILREALRLQSDGTLDIRNALGATGSVYLTVPADRGGTGKVNVLVQEQLREFEAVTEEAESIPTGADILVTGITKGDTLIVVKK